MLNIDTKALLHYTRLHRREVIFVPHWAVAYITPLSDPVCATEQKSLRFVGDAKSNLVYATPGKIQVYTANPVRSVSKSALMCTF